MKKSASILDYSYPFLDPAVWDHEQKLYSYHKDFILRLLDKMYVTYQLKQPEAWITDIRVIGSLTTSKWLFTSDMDVHMVVNLAKFIEINMPGADPKVAYEFLDATRKEFDRAKILAPMTQHPIEYYFEVPEFVTTNTSMVGIYSISQDAWLKAPVIFEADVDFEESKKQVMTQAEAIAQALDGSFGKIDRQIDRISELERMIAAWDTDKQQLFYNKVEEKLKGIEAEILKDLELRQALIDARHAAQDPMADIEIKFKWLQRFGFFGILTNLKNLMTETGGQVTLQELPLLKMIVTDSSLKQAFLKEALERQTLAIDFDDTIAHENEDKSIGEPQEGVKDAITKLKEDGYIIEIYSARANEEDGADEIKEWLESHEIPYDTILNVEKPIATHYIDDRAIKFTNWSDVVKQVEKSDKKASLSVIANLADKYWLDPQGKAYNLGSEGLSHGGWVTQNRKLLEGYGFEFPNEYWEKSQGLFEVADTMLQNGWTRITTESDYDFAVEVADLNNLPSYLDNFVAQHYTGGGIEIDDLSGEYQDIEDPFPSLAKAIYQARRLRNAASRAFSKRDIKAHNYDVLGDPSLRQGQPRAVFNFVQKGMPEFGLPDLDMFDVLGDHPRYGSTLNRKEIEELGIPITEDKVAKQAGNRVKVGTLSTDRGNLPVYVDKAYLDKYVESIAALNKINPYGTGEYTPNIAKLDKERTKAHDAAVASALSYLKVNKDDFYWSVREIISDFAESVFSKKYANLKQAKTKKIKQGDYSCIMAMIPHGIAQEIVEFGVREIPDEDLYTDEEGNLGRELQAHVTIEYGLLTDDAKHVRRSFNHSKPFKAKLGKVRHFQPPERDFDVVTVEVISEDLTEANKMIVDKFDCADDLPSSNEYKPHITVAYVKRNAAKKHIGSDEFEGIEIELDTLVFSPRVGNKTYFSIASNQEKKAEFLPSLTTPAPDNDWQFASGGDDKEIPVDPDTVSDESTYYAPCTVGKPRTKEVWRQFISMFSNLFSKKDTTKIESALDENLIYIGNVKLEGKKTHILKIEVPQELLDQYFAIVIDMKKALNDPKLTDKELATSSYWDKLDRTRANIHDQLVQFAFNRLFEGKNWFDFPGVSFDIRDKISNFIEDMVPRDDLPKKAAYDKELQEEEKDALGEDQTAHEYSKDFKDLNGPGKPHNTQWFQTYQDQEPSKPLPVTYSPQISNEDNLDQNSPGGYPRRFMGKPKGEWFSNEGEVNNTLIQMLRNRTAMIESTTTDITKEAFLDHAYWIDPKGQAFEVRGAENNNSDYTHWNWIADHQDTLKEIYGLNGIVDRDELVDAGWTRIGDSSTDNWQVEVADIMKVPSFIDNILAQFASDGAEIDFADHNENFVQIQWPWKNIQGAINRALRSQLPMAASLKEAMIEQVDGITILINPTFNEVLGLWKRSESKHLRMLTDTITGEKYLWDAYFATHDEIMKKLTGFRDTLQKDDLDNLTVIRSLFKESSLKQAGSQSASVPDYLIDEWKTEQIMNNTDEEPYVNHDQRDYPYGMHDSPENTGSGIGWPQDNSRAVVRLDTLENPAFRLDPFGIGEYNVTYYTGMPASDGIEKSNPD